MDSEALTNFLKANELFSDFSLEEIKSLLNFIKVHTFEKGFNIFNEGDEGQELYLIEKGSIEVIKWTDQEKGLYHALEKVGAGDYFGEMAFVEKRERSASVVALEPVNIFIIDLRRLSESSEHANLSAKLFHSLVQRVSQRLRKTGDSLIDSLTERLKFIQKHDQISKTLIYIFIILALWFNVAKLIGLFPIPLNLYENIVSPTITATFILIFFLSIIHVIKKSGYPISFYGISLKNGLSHSIEAFFFSIPFILFFIGLKWILITNVDSLKGAELFETDFFSESRKAILIVGSIYIIFVPLQEFIARGFLQSCFKNFYQGPHNSWYAILSSNLLFHVYHISKDFWIAIISFFLGIFWGFLYERQKTIVGVSVSHALIGLFNFFILNLQEVFLKIFF